MLTRLAALPAFLLAVALMVAPGADASPPITTEETSAGDDFIADCGDFDLRDSWTFDEHGKEFLDDQGEVTRIVIHVAGTDTFYNSETGESVTGTINSGETVDFVNGQVTQNGVVARITVPGHGVVFFDVGKYVITFGEGLTFIAGRHHGFFDEDYTALCELLG